MEVELIKTILFDLFVVLTIGFFAGIICKSLSLSLIAGYFLVGAFVGNSGLDLISKNHHELEYLAHAGAMFLLFSVGIEFSINELINRWKYIIFGGALQMSLVTLPLIVICMLFKMELYIAILASLAASLSSTVLVFKSLSELGASMKPYGQRGLSILIFQDIALVPLILIVPLLTKPDNAFEFSVLGMLLLKALAFVCLMLLLRQVVTRWLIPLVYRLQSVELVVLFAVSILLASCIMADRFELPAAIGALTAGLVLSDNRLSHQIDAIILPFREIFSSVFFVSLGLLLDPSVFIKEPLLIMAGLVGILFLKTFAATMSLKITGLEWKSAMGMGLGLSQLGEFSFLLISSAMLTGALVYEDYNRMLFIAIVSLIITPQLIKWGISFIEKDKAPVSPTPTKKGLAIVVGVGLVGRQAKQQLEGLNYEVNLIDQNFINLHDFSSKGIQTVIGDAREYDVLSRANIQHCDILTICVTEDAVSEDIIRNVRGFNRDIMVVSYCRYIENIEKIKLAGANKVISKELEVENDFKVAFDGI